MALSLLPPDVIPAGFTLLQKQVETSEAREFMAYYNTHWLEKWGPEHYSVFRKEVRTNNDMEGLYCLHYASTSYTQLFTHAWYRLCQARFFLYHHEMIHIL